MDTLTAVKQGQVSDGRKRLVQASVAAVVSSVRIQAEAERLGITTEFFKDTSK